LATFQSKKRAANITEGKTFSYSSNGAIFVGNELKFVLFSSKKRGKEHKNGAIKFLPMFYHFGMPGNFETMICRHLKSFWELFEHSLVKWRQL